MFSRVAGIPALAVTTCGSGLGLGKGQGKGETTTAIAGFIYGAGDPDFAAVEIDDFFADG